jgi:hypothetical protein
MIESAASSHRSAGAPESTMIASLFWRIFDHEQPSREWERDDAAAAVSAAIRARLREPAASWRFGVPVRG